MVETKRSITEEVDHKPNVKISTISSSAKKTFLAKNLLDDSGDGMVELLHNE